MSNLVTEMRAKVAGWDAQERAQALRVVEQQIEMTEPHLAEAEGGLKLAADEEAKEHFQATVAARRRDLQELREVRSLLRS